MTTIAQKIEGNTNIQTQLLAYFKRNRQDLTQSYKEVKAHILNSKDATLRVVYKVHIEELIFYGLI